MLPLRIADLSESRETLASSPRASLEKYTRLRTMPSSVVNPVAVRYNVRFLLVELLDKYAVRCTSRRALSHSIAGSRNRDTVHNGTCLERENPAGDQVHKALGCVTVLVNGALRMAAHATCQEKPKMANPGKI